MVSNEFGTDLSRQWIVRLSNSPVVLVNGVDLGGGSTARVDYAAITMNKAGTARDIYYTLDGTQPDFTGYFYTGAFNLSNSATIRAIAYNSTYTDWAEAAPIYVEIWPYFTLTFTTPGGGSIARTPAPHASGNRWLSNTVVTLTATPSNGWTFLRWTGDSTATTNVIDILLDRPKATTGVFGTPLSLFTNGPGALAVSPPLDYFPCASTGHVFAIPDPGNDFFGWAKAATGFANPVQIRFTTATPGSTALFGGLKAGQASLTALPNGNGTIGISPSQKVFSLGDSVTLTATPTADSLFIGWSGDASGTQNPLPLQLNSNKSVVANFILAAGAIPPVIAQNPVGLTVAQGGSAALSVQVTGSGPFAYQWRFNGMPIARATDATLLLLGMTPAAAGLYDVVVTGPGGAVTSSAAVVGLTGIALLPAVVVDGAPGTSYRIEYSDELQPVNWSLLAPVTLLTNRLPYGDETATNRFRRFYRVVPK